MLTVADNPRTGFTPEAESLNLLSNALAMNFPTVKSEGTNPESSDFMARIQQVLDDLRRNDGGEAPTQEAPAPWGEVNRGGVEEKRPLEGGDNVKPGEGEEPIEGVRRQVQELQQKLAESETHRATLEQQLADLRANRNQDSTASELEEKLRVQRLEIERERAELDRQRSELEYERRGIERSRNHDEINERIQVLRQHLQEIHAREQTQRQGSLAAWITQVREQIGQAVQRWIRPRPQQAKHANQT